MPNLQLNSFLILFIYIKKPFVCENTLCTYWIVQTVFVHSCLLFTLLYKVVNAQKCIHPTMTKIVHHAYMIFTFFLVQSFRSKPEAWKNRETKKNCSWAKALEPTPTTVNRLFHTTFSKCSFSKRPLRSDLLSYIYYLSSLYSWQRIFIFPYDGHCHVPPPQREKILIVKKTITLKLLFKNKIKSAQRGHFEPSSKHLDMIPQ